MPNLNKDMNQDKIAEYAQCFIDNGFEEDRAWEVARLIVKPQEERTDEENKIVHDSVEEYRENTLKSLKTYPYISKLASDLHCSDWWDRLCSGMEDLLREDYKKVGSPYGNTDEGFAKWQTELDNINKMQERLKRILEELD
jgi:hypothetical protein